MGRVDLSLLAQHDVLSIRDYIAQFNPRAANQLIDLLEKNLSLIATNPVMGEARPEFGADIRIFTVKNYVAVYKYVEDGIYVSRILHSARDFETILRMENQSG